MPSIVDDERRRMSPQPPSALRVGAAWGHLRRWHSSPMPCIACTYASLGGVAGHLLGSLRSVVAQAARLVASPWNSPQGAPNATHCTSSTGLEIEAI